MFSKITFVKSVRSKEKDEACHSFLENIFTKSVHRGGVKNVKVMRLGSVAFGYHFILYMYTIMFISVDISNRKLF